MIRIYFCDGSVLILSVRPILSPWPVCYFWYLLWSLVNVTIKNIPKRPRGKRLSEKWKPTQILFFPTFCFSLQKQTLNLKIATILLMNIPNYNHWCCFYEVSVTSGHWNMRSRYLTRKATDRPPIENYVLVIVARENRRSRSILI